MEGKKFEEERIEIMMSEYIALREEIRLLMSAMIRDFQIFLAFIGAILALSIRGSTGGQNSNELFRLQDVISFVPYLFFAFSLFFLIKMAQGAIIATYIRNIENRINLFFDSKVLNWESSIVPNFLFKLTAPFVLSELLFGLLLLLGYISCALLGYYKFIPEHSFFSSYRYAFGVIYIACPILFFVLVILIFRKNKKLDQEINKLLKKK